MTEIKTSQCMLKGYDNTKMYCVMDIPKNPKAVLIIVHGYGEHLGNYNYVKEQFNSYGYAVCRFELRGHGKSEGERGHVNHFKDFCRDLDKVVDFVKNDYEELPIYMLGHSMGGMIVSLYGIDYPNRVDGQILSSAATLEPKESKGIKGPILKIANKIAPKYHIKNTVRRNDKELEYVTLNLFVQFLVYGIQYVKKNLYRYTYPCLILHGKEDKIIEKEASINLYSKINSSDKKMNIYEGKKHVLLRKDSETFKDIDDWISHRISD